MIQNQQKDIVIACCRDEQDIIIEFINFYLDMGFDRICFIDNGSQDNTVNLICQHPASEHISLQIDLRPGHDKHLLEYYHVFAHLATRWVFFIDVDEFILLPGGIKEYARALPPDVTVLHLPFLDMLPEGDLDDEVHPLLRTRRQAQRWPEDPDKYVWKQVKVQQIFGGKHKVELEPYREYHDDNLIVRHYPTRSEQQFRRKIFNRLDSLETINEEEMAQYVSASPDNFKNYLAYSRQFLSPKGWMMEKERISQTPWITDRVIQNWFLAYQCKQRKMLPLL